MVFGVGPVRAQDDDGSCTFDLTAVNELLTQAQTAHTNGDTVTALNLLNQAQVALDELEADCLVAIANDAGPEFLTLALLTSEDLPAGWTVQAAAAPLTTTSTPASVFCAELDTVFAIEGVSVSYLSNGLPNGLLQTIYYFPNGDATTYFGLAQTAAESCVGLTWQQLFQGSVTVDASLTLLETPSLENGFGVKVTNTGLPDFDTLQTATIYIQHGNYIIALAYYLAGEGDLDDGQALDFAEAALNKLIRFEAEALGSGPVANAELFLTAVGAGQRETAAGYVCESAKSSLDNLFALFEAQAGEGTFSLTGIACTPGQGQRIDCTFTIEVVTNNQTIQQPQDITFLMDGAGLICGSE